MAYRGDLLGREADDRAGLRGEVGVGEHADFVEVTATANRLADSGIVDIFRDRHARAEAGVRPSAAEPDHHAAKVEDSEFDGGSGGHDANSI